MSLLFIRADGNSTVGSGHIMRCLSIAEALRQKQIDCVFVCADDAMKTRIEEKGFSVVCLETAYCEMDQELPKLLELIETRKPQGILADSYFVTEQYMQTVHNKVPLAYMDDLNAFDYPVDLLINYNLFSDTLNYGDSQAKLALGCSYTPLREEFQKILPRKPFSNIKNILVSTGGADPLGIGLVLLEYAYRKTEYQWDFVVGGLSDQREKMSACAKGRSHIHLHQSVQKMSKLMLQCDFAISASGCTLYELCAAGTPTCCYTFADNQALATEIFAQKGLMYSLGDYRLGAQEFLKKLDRILSEADPQTLQAMSHQMQTVVDGHGAQRAADEILKIMADQG